MELDFDKEIDALLRKAQRDAPVLVGDFASQRHLDADEISAFAENAMPQNSRALYTAHLAECDRCRKVLSNLLMMNAETVPAAASVPSAITIAERAPWYKRLFLFPNLAYVMGGLVLVFAGFLGYTVMKNVGGGDGAIVSQVSDAEYQPAASGPNFQSELSANANANTSMMSANTAANVAMSSNSAMANTNSAALDDYKATKEPIAGAKGGENSFVLDGVSSSTDTTAAAPPPAAASQPAPKDDREREELAKEKPADKVLGYAVPELPKNESVLKQAPGAQNYPAQSGPMRNSENQYNRQLENLDRRADLAAKSKKSTRNRDEDSSPGRRVVGGKTFEKKQGVWYDVSYQGRPTINVRRGTDEFGRLDAGIRSIANSLGGTVVVVWGAKAYRIQ